MYTHTHTHTNTHTNTNTHTHTHTHTHTYTCLFMLILQYCEKGRLFDQLYKKGLSPDRPTALRMATEIALAMATVHKQGIMHRCAL